LFLVEQAKTLAAVQTKVAAVQVFKGSEAPRIFDEHFRLESLWVNLSTRLANGGRPVFVPPLSMSELTAQVHALRERENVVEDELHAELSRHQRLHATSDIHTVRTTKLTAWAVDRHTRVIPVTAAMTSSGAARVALNMLRGLAAECAAVKDGSLAAILALGKSLATDGYEVGHNSHGPCFVFSNLISVANRMRRPWRSVKKPLLRRSTSSILWSKSRSPSPRTHSSARCSKKRYRKPFIL
jgi:hypothetical protein